MAKIFVQVQAYADHEGGEQPASFTLLDRVFQVRAIIDQWYGTDHLYFKVRADDGNLYLLRHDLEGDEWELVMMETIPR